MPRLTAIARQAGAIIMRYYEGGVDVMHKEDDSPVTEADIAANAYIVEQLSALTQEIPIVAEESDNTAHDPAGMAQFWLVDPLDGTKSFIARRGQFTVNIGLVEEGVPVLGVIYVPVQDVLYYTGEDGQAYKQEADGAPERITCRMPGEDGLVVVASKSHRTQETNDFIAELSVAEVVSAASSLKFCLVAEGKADIYPRFGTTMEWDTAAGHAVLLAAGGQVTHPDGAAFGYGKPEFRNTYFIAWGRRE